ncbi:glycosyltransferase family 2 protein [Mediterraneibacter faecis]|uniref:glycosyltransferase family 2 protein n=1 Tax=Mediterraneibacter faecis TaxID=592978 RepID=UPI001D06B830|nr:glycosyltransferase family 2 protein [Mediterraneibacter faecis]MCB5920268.1 glycosyltransferase [Lachnospiraceae bacterium 210521-DFI.1.105]MCB6298280.1 glycosyltransferase [Mediterraneibacter faecis]MCB6444798.1 glycosyltransferase [Mediterraneibacter faecis]MCQ5257015.1 glycosyltransferase [Mediterraneibacter faecis]MCQ5259867.1 glycosyltransferase [Mediterraneibacter faecis]
MKKHPRVTIVTVCYNSEKYLEDCIKSIMNQTYDNVEHIIVDGESKDNTLDIIKKYDGKYNMRWISEPDNGMYDAIYKGFQMATGDIYAWLNSDDMYMPWACELVAKVMEETDVEWCTGIPCHYTESGIAYNIPRVTPVFPRKFILKGYMDGRVATFLEQESMFWSKKLWDLCGNTILRYKYAGDYHLWREFSKYQQLITLDSVVSGFRIHKGQKSEDRNKYYGEIGSLNLINKLLKQTKLIPLIMLTNALFTRKSRVRTAMVLKK